PRSPGSSTAGWERTSRSLRPAEARRLLRRSQVSNLEQWDEQRPCRRTVEADQGQDEGAVGQADRRRDRPARGQERAVGRQIAGEIRDRARLGGAPGEGLPYAQQLELAPGSGARQPCSAPDSRLRSTRGE